MPLKTLAIAIVTILHVLYRSYFSSEPMDKTRSRSEVLKFGSIGGIQAMKSSNVEVTIFTGTLLAAFISKILSYVR